MTKSAKPFIVFHWNVFSISCYFLKFGKLFRITNQKNWSRWKFLICNFSLAAEIPEFLTVIFWRDWSKCETFESETSHVGSKKKGHEYRLDDFEFFTRWVAAYFKVPCPGQVLLQRSTSPWSDHNGTWFMGSLKMICRAKWIPSFDNTIWEVTHHITNIHNKNVFFRFNLNPDIIRILILALSFDYPHPHPIPAI